MKEVTIDHDAWDKVIRFPEGRYDFKHMIFDLKKGKKRLVACWILEFRIHATQKRRRRG